MTKNHRFRLALSLLITGFYCSAQLGHSAFAQNAPGFTSPGLLVPAPTQQGSDQQRQRESEKTLPDDTQVEPEAQFDIPKQPTAIQIESPKFMANTITLESVTVLTEAEKQALVQPYQGRELTLDDLETLVEAVMDAYREKGYMTTQAFVPPQDVQGGNVSIKVVEGRVGQLAVSGNRFNRVKTVLRNIDIEQGQIFNLKELEQDLNRSNQMNDFRVRATLSPGEETGETNVQIDVAERQPWQISPTFDNQGRPFIGMYRGGVELTNNSLFGFGDRLATRYIGADGTNVALASYFIPINKNGDEIGISYGFSRVDVDLPAVPRPEIIGTAHNVGILYSHPFDEDRTWVGDVGFNIRRIRTEFNGIADTPDNIRSLQVGLNFNKVDRLGRTFARAQSSIGMGILGGNESFWKAEGILQRVFNLPRNNIFFIRAYGQYSPNALPTAEAFQIGGAYSVRGYTEGLLIGDRGYTITLEDRFPIPFLDNVSPWLAERVQGAVFFDIGQAFNDSSNPLFAGNSASNTLLMGAGFGLRARLTQYMQGFMDVGFGLLDRNNVISDPNGHPTARIHFGIRSDFLPVVYKQRNDDVNIVDPRRIRKLTNQAAAPQPAEKQEAKAPEGVPAAELETTPPPQPVSQMKSPSEALAEAASTVKLK